ncbi:hypothetical protein V6N11_054116 [Hibiscus sabdariffa]|uniref:Uncharacterized protein n=1 Tax=Hibiscus sabdariffa TaxID=183260 RepID=A0ABR2S2Y2_9ROSI
MRSGEGYDDVEVVVVGAVVGVIMAVMKWAMARVANIIKDEFCVYDVKRTVNVVISSMLQCMLGAMPWEDAGAYLTAIDDSAVTELL